MKLLIKNGYVVSLRDGLADKLDVLAEDGIITDVSKDISEKGADTVINAENLCVSAGLVDLIANVSEPAEEGEEDLFNLCHAAAKGGYTALCVHSGTDTPEKIRNIAEKEPYCACSVIPAVRATDGRELLKYGDLKLFGARAIYDDEPISDPLLMRDALFRARKYDVPLLVRCKEKAFYNEGIARSGVMAELMDIPQIPACAESIIAARDIVLSADTGSAVHLAHISCAESVELIRRAKAEGIRVTCSTEPQYFSLTSRELMGYNTLAKVDPPLGNRKDVEAVLGGVADGTIDIITSGHTPRSDASKRKSLVTAPFGASSLEITLAASVTALHHNAGIELSKVMDLMTAAPAELLGLKTGRIRKGDVADLCIFDKDHEFTVKGKTFISKGHNTPFENKKLYGTVLWTVKDGRVTWQTAE